MAESVVKEVKTVITAEDRSGPAVKTFENRLDQLRSNANKLSSLDPAAGVSRRISQGRLGLDDLGQSTIERQRRVMARTAEQQAQRSAIAESLRAERRARQQEMAEIQKENEEAAKRAAMPQRQVNRTQIDQDARNIQADRIRKMRADTRRAAAEALADERLFGQKMAAEVRNTNERVVREARNGTDRVAKERRQLSMLDRVKSVLGGRGPVKDVAELLVGGGAIAAVGFITNTIARGAQNARELVDRFREGAIDAKQLRVELAGTIPVIGGIVRAMRDVHEAFTGQQAAIRQIREEGEVMKRSTEAREKIEERTQRAREQSLKTIRDINREMQLRFAPESVKSLRQLEFDTEDRRESTRQSTGQTVAQNRSDAASRAEEINKNLRIVADERKKLEAELRAIDEQGRVNGRQELRRRIQEVSAREQGLQEDLLATVRIAKDAQIKLEADAQEQLKLIERNAQQERRKILIEGGKEQVKEFLKTWLERARVGKERMEEERKAEIQHRQNMAQARRERDRQNIQESQAGFRFAERQAAKFSPGRGTATTEEVRFATRVGRPEDNMRPLLDEFRKSTVAITKVEKVVNDFFRFFTSNQPVVEIFGN